MARERKRKRGAGPAQVREVIAPHGVAIADRGARSVWIPLLILAGVTLAVYAGTLQNGFVADDESQLLLNPYVTDYHFIPKLLTSDVWAFNPNRPSPSNYYRPVQMLAYLAEYYAFDSHLWAWHLFNVLANLAAVFAAYFLIRALGAARLGFWSAVWFALHPMHVEAVAWVAALPDLQCGVGLFTGMWLYHRARTGAHPWRDHALAAGVFFLALLAKETALSFPGLVLAYEFLYRKESLRTLVRAAARYAPYAGGLVLYVAMRLHALGKFAPATGSHFQLTPWETLLSAFTLVAQYVGKLLLPVGFNFFYLFHPIRQLGWEPLAGMTIVALLVAGAVRLRRGRPVAALALAWFGITLLPVLSISNVGENVFTERYLYIPSLGFCILAGEATVWVLDRTASRPVRWGAYAALAAIGGFYTLQIVRRVPDWHDSLRLFLKTVELSPDSVVVQESLGLAYYQAGYPEKSIEHSQRALELRPDDPATLMNLATALSDLRRYADAVEYLRRATQLHPAFADAWVQLGKAYANLGQWENAAESYQRALALRSGDPVTLTALGLAYQNSGRLGNALEAFRQAVSIAPSYPAGHISLGVALYQTGRVDEAIEELLAALRLHPQPFQASVAHYNLGLNYEAKKYWDAAAAEYQQALELTPGFTQARERLDIVSREEVHAPR
jgi:tetratricopeptide (TPR) repeat protein